MTKQQRVFNYLSIIAIILSIISILLVLTVYSNLNYRCELIDSRSQQAFNLAINNREEMASHLADVTGDLQDYHKCITDGIEDFVTCKADEATCRNYFLEKRQLCENSLRESAWFD